MTTTIGIIGIDGSGKSTLTAALADLACAELGVTTASVGDDVRVKSPTGDLLMPGFAPDGELWSARLSRFARRLAKFFARHSRRWYPLFKLAHLALQEQVVKDVRKKYSPDLLFCDGNFFLSSAGRSVNYLHVAGGSMDSSEAIKALYMALTLPGQAKAKMGVFDESKMAHGLRWINRILRLDLFRLPDALLFVDVSPEIALARRAATGQPLDQHENRQDMAQAQTMYQAVTEFFSHLRGADRTRVIDAGNLSLSATLRNAMEFASGLARDKHAVETGRRRLGTTQANLSEKATLLKRILTFRYLFRYAAPNLWRGSANEMTFPFSSLGRLFLREGYSANVMKVIYLRDSERYGWLDRIFLDYPLHRAVYHRLKILQPIIETEVRARLEKLSGDEVLRIFTAPSGYAFDLFPPLARIVRSEPGLARRIRLVASDLDSDGRMETELAEQANELGISFEFVRGDLTIPEMREVLVQGEPYDLVLFVGLSSWLSKPHLLDHMRFIRGRLLASDGTLVSDSFTPDAFSLSGNYAGYDANYYAPRDYANLLAFCGFDPKRIFWMSGAEGINHVCSV